MLKFGRFFIIILISILYLSSCSVFQKSKKINMAPFSDNAGTLFSEATKVSRPFQFKLLRPYVGIEEFTSISKTAAPLLEALRGVVYYSNQVVAINNSNFKDREKNRQLARYLYEVLEKAIINQKLDSLQLDEMGAKTILNNIQNAETYLDGIAAASPIINSVVVAILKRLDKIAAAIVPISVALDREIEKDYGTTRKNYKRLVNLQEQLMLSITRIYRARIGYKAELDTLIQENVSLTDYIPSAENASPPQLAAAESYLLEQLHQINIMFSQLDEIKMSYIAKQEELIVWRAQVDEKIMIARTAMTIWAQSHRNLGDGIPVPPLFDVTGFATGLLGTATHTVIP
jgi:hypothetical protein